MIFCLFPTSPLPADTKKGTRAGFSTAAEPSEGEKLFLELAETLTNRFPSLQTGVFAPTCKSPSPMMARLHLFWRADT
ncbi:D-aminoacyl-tRNA deacylase [Mariprofundus aestuarium]|uniref:D-aminoacyl-tRNA deacylase n=1 Tax=Mariprofundus aestuarium TaxID=1921086 RepID=UPI003AAA4388